jgi:hypothetical protein
LLRRSPLVFRLAGPSLSSGPLCFIRRSLRTHD